MNTSSEINIYFVGIGGIGMSAIARHYKALGRNVAGYDRTPTVLTHELEAEGIIVSFSDDVQTIPTEFLNPETTLVVFTPAIAESNAILSFFRQKKFRIEKRAVVLGRLASEKYDAICVAGTHGKTTTSTLAAHILRSSSVGCTAFLGGVAANYQTNYWFDGKSSFVVTEADEYDRSFHQLHPHLALITATDADHLDIYGTHAEVKKAFAQFAQNIQPGGALIANTRAEIDFDSLPEEIEIFTYSREKSAEADFYATNIKLVDGHYRFNIVSPYSTLKNLELSLPGLHNVENAVGATALALLAGASEDDIREAMLTFRGNRRRFEVKLQTSTHCLIDDYAHHPEEISTMLTSVRALYAGRDLTVVFQPHLYTRTRDFASGFASALSLADHVLLLDIYPAREEPIEGVDSQMLAVQMTTDVTLTTKERLLTDLQAQQRDVVVMMGAGNIDAMVPSVEEMMKNL